MRPGAQVYKLALAVQADVLARARVLLDEFLFVGLVLEQLQRFGCVGVKALDGQRLVHNARHLLLNHRQDFGGERGLHVEIVVKAVCDGRADGELRAREQAQHGLCQNVAARVPKGVLAFVVVKCEKLHGAVAFKRRAQIHRLAVHAACAHGLRQLRPQAFGHGEQGCPLLIFAHAAILQCDFDHKPHLLKIKHPGLKRPG